MQDAIGVDISKDTLDAYHEGTRDDRQFANSAAGLRAFCRWASGCDGAAIVFEASGACHRDLERELARQGLTFSKVNPRQARRFAEAIGRVAKTDKLPSRDIAVQCASGQRMPEFWPEWGPPYNWHRPSPSPNTWSISRNCWFSGARSSRIVQRPGPG